MDKDLGSFINGLLWKAQGFRTSLNPRVAAGIMHSALGYAGATENAQTAAAAHRYGADVGLEGEQFRGATGLQAMKLREKGATQRQRLIQSGEEALRNILLGQFDTGEKGDLNAALGGEEPTADYNVLGEDTGSSMDEDPEEERIRSLMLNQRFEELRNKTKKQDTLMGTAGSSVRVPLGISAFQKLYDWTR